MKAIHLIILLVIGVIIAALIAPYFKIIMAIVGTIMFIGIIISIAGESDINKKSNQK